MKRKGQEGVGRHQFRNRRSRFPTIADASASYTFILIQDKERNAYLSIMKRSMGEKPGLFGVQAQREGCCGW